MKRVASLTYGFGGSKFPFYETWVKTIQNMFASYVRGYNKGAGKPVVYMSTQHSDSGCVNIHLSVTENGDPCVIFREIQELGYTPNCVYTVDKETRKKMSVFEQETDLWYDFHITYFIRDDDSLTPPLVSV